MTTGKINVAPTPEARFMMLAAMFNGEKTALRYSLQVADRLAKQGKAGKLASALADIAQRAQEISKTAAALSQIAEQLHQQQLAAQEAR